MTGPVGDPGLRLAGRQAQGDERAAEVVHAQTPAIRARREQLRPVDAGEPHVGAKPSRELLLVDGAPVLLDEHEVAALQAAELGPLRQGPHDVGIHGPVARVVGLVLVEADGAALQVDLDPEPHCHGFADPAALAREEAPQHAVAERHLVVGRREQRCVVGGVQVREGGRLADLRHEADGQGTRLDVPARVGGEPQHAAHHLCVVPARAGPLSRRRQLPHR
ncbi:MAG TPA: hypothetical protein VHB79_10440 [Polyangiaceae bacterium]|nr:hypothetical protein [Polyangiaceae bacterium]